MESQGLDFTAAMRPLCRDMVTRLSELSHIDLDRVAISLSRARQRSVYGLYASLTPLRFESGRSRSKMHGRTYGVQSIRNSDGEEFLYILSFYLPRFLDSALEEKLSTILHELWHISPQFDGDLRRHEGRCYAHGPSQQAYDAHMDRLAQRWLSLDPPSALYEFLASSFDELVAEYGQIVGTHWPTPKLIPL